MKMKCKGAFIFMSSMTRTIRRSIKNHTCDKSENHGLLSRIERRYKMSKKNKDRNRVKIV